MRSSSQEPEWMDLPDDVSAGLRDLRRRRADCPEPELLQALQGSVLPPAVGDLLTRHVEICPTCKSLMENLAALEDAPLQPNELERIWRRLQRTAKSEASFLPNSHPAWRWKFPRWLWPVALAAAAVILLVLAAGFFYERLTGPVITATRGRETRPPSTAFRLEKAPVMLPASAALVFRGAGDGNPLEKEFSDALAPYKSDDYAQAAERFENLARKYPQLPEARFYLGVSRLFLNANEDAARDLEAARREARPPLLDESSWYLALAYQRLGGANDARPLLQTLCHGTSRNSARACLAVQALP